MTSTGGGAPPPAPETRDWAALPRDILSAVFLRLGPREVMLGAEFACTAWRRVALDEPALWRRLGKHEWRQQFYLYMGDEMKLAAVDRAAGKCEAFTGSFDTAEDLLHLAKRAPCLKTLYLTHSRYQDSIEDLAEALKKLPLLEYLHISIPHIISDEYNILGSICKACPRLRKLKVMYASPSDLVCSKYDYPRERIDGGITLMPELRSLKLSQVYLSLKALNDILDNCPVLECLYVGGFFSKRKMDEDLRLKCARVKNLTLPSPPAAIPDDYLFRENCYYNYDENCYYNYSSEDYDDDKSEDDDNSEYDSEE